MNATSSNAPRLFSPHAAAWYSVNIGTTPRAFAAAAWSETYAPSLAVQEGQSSPDRYM
ncbi:MAG: hypothetical protein KIS78_05925 [Labilithrix sp.]|nr:hypothetical protein [Labilithrix sp.]